MSTLYRPIPLTADAIYTPVNHENVHVAEQRRQLYQHTLNQYPFPEPDKGAGINASLFEVSVVELPAGLTRYGGGMMCLPSLVVLVLASNGILRAETAHIDINRENHTNAPVIESVAPQGLPHPNDGCLYFDILIQECLHLGLSELHTRMMEYERLLGRADQLEILALVVFYALSGDEDFLYQFLNQDLPAESLRLWWHSKPELHRDIDDYIFFAFFNAWSSYR